MNEKPLYVIMDGDFMVTKGAPSSNRNHYAIFGSRYVRIFRHVKILCRVHHTEDPEGLLIGGPGVEAVPLAPIHGLRGILRYGTHLARAFFSIPRGAAVILRVPGINPSLAWFVIMLRRLPYAVEAMADADAQFAHGAYRRRFRAIYRVLWASLMRLQCRYAAASSYVTRDALQKLYPPAAGRPTFSYTTLDLPESALALTARSVKSFEKPTLTLINVAMMQKHLKGQDTIIRAVAELDRMGVRVRLVLVGDGDTREYFETLANELKVRDRVEFTGRVQAGSEVFALLDKSDIFVLPSRQEGLPRVVIEAMARALPCLASDLPGNHELLSKDFIAPIDDWATWAAKIKEMVAQPELLAKASERNLKLAGEYTSKHTQTVRDEFYSLLQNPKG